MEGVKERVIVCQGGGCRIKYTCDNWNGEKMSFDKDKVKNDVSEPKKCGFYRTGGEIGLMKKQNKGRG